jgi:hypothetical protein
VIAFASILDSRSGFQLAALFVTWVAIVFLVLIAVSLHIRLQRLERLDFERSQTAPFSHLLGKTVGEILNGSAPRPQPRLILFLSSSCPSCDRLLTDLQHSVWHTPVAIVWTTPTLDRVPELPPQVTLVPDGAAISAMWRIRVTPFALVADEGGVIIQAAPINSLDPLRAAIQAAPKIPVASLSP